MKNIKSQWNRTDEITRGITMNTRTNRRDQRMKKPMAVIGTGLFCLLAMPVFGQWYIEVGPVYRGDMDISVHGGSRAADSGVSGARDGTTGGRPSAPTGLLNDDGTTQILREFENGYVGPSGWDWARAEGWSQYFGYNHPEQYDAAADTLSFNMNLNQTSATQRRTITRVSDVSEGWSDSTDADGVGIMGTAGYLFGSNETFAVAAQMRFGWLSGVDGSFHNRPAYEQRIERSFYEDSIRAQETYVYTYDTLGNPVFPDAPYAMTDPAGVGPLIADTPDSITQSGRNNQTVSRASGRSVEKTVSLVDLDVDADLLTFQLGPRLQWQVAPSLTLLVQPAITANMLDSSLRRQETFRRGDGSTIAAWSDRANDQDWRIGMGVEVGAKLALSETWYLLVSGGYEWVDEYNLSVGPDRVEMDLSGYQAEIAIGVAL